MYRKLIADFEESGIKSIKKAGAADRVAAALRPVRGVENVKRAASHSQASRIQDKPLSAASKSAIKKPIWR